MGWRLIGGGALLLSLLVAGACWYRATPESERSDYMDEATYKTAVEEFLRWCPEKRTWPEGEIPSAILSDVVDFEIPVGSIDHALGCLGRQSGIAVQVEGEFDSPDVRRNEQKKTLSPVTGKQPVLDAARQILHGTNFVIESDASDSFRLAVRLNSNAK